MQVINSSEAIQSVPWPEIRQLIQIRFRQNDLNQDHGYLIHSFVVVDVNDSAQDIEQEICNQLRQIKTADGEPLDEEFTPSFEWIVTHPYCYEAAFIHCDREFGVCLLIPREEGIDSELLEWGECYGFPAPV